MTCRTSPHHAGTSTAHTPPATAATCCSQHHSSADSNTITTPHNPPRQPDRSCYRDRGAWIGQSISPLTAAR